MFRLYLGRGMGKSPSPSKRKMNKQPGKPLTVSEAQIYHKNKGRISLVRPQAPYCQITYWKGNHSLLMQESGK